MLLLVSMTMLMWMNMRLMVDMFRREADEEGAGGSAHPWTFST
jgi:hypothetical protein